jgi:hypothetical protein
MASSTRAGAWLVLVILVLAAGGSFIDRGFVGSGVQSDLPTLEAMAIDSGERFRDPIALRRERPGSHLVMGENCRPFDEIRYRALAQPASVARAVLPDIDFSQLDVTQSFQWREHNYRMYLAEGGPRGGPRHLSEQLFVYCRGVRTFEIVDSRLAPGSKNPESMNSDARLDERTRRLGQEKRRLATDVTADLSIFAALLILGTVLLPSGLGALRPALSLLLGMSMWGLLGLSLLGTSSMVALAGLVVLLRVGIARQKLPLVLSWTRADLGPFFVFAGLVTGMVVRVRSGGWHFVHTDSMAFLLGGWAFAAHAMTPELLIPKRGVILQSLHGPGFLLRVEGLQSLAPVVFLSGLWVLLASVSSRYRNRLAILSGVALTTVMLVMSPTLVRASALINSHLLVAGLLLALVVLWHHGVHDSDGGTLRGSAAAAAVLASAVVLLRAEGVLVIGLLLLGTLWSGRQWAYWSLVWRAAGMTSVVWGLQLVAGATRQGAVAGMDRWAAVVLGVVVFTAPTLIRVLAAMWRRKIPPLILAFMWAATLMVLLIRGSRVRFFSAARENVLAAGGGWGLLWVTVFLLVLLGLSRAFARQQTAALGPGLSLLVGYVPLSMFVKMADNVRELNFNRLLGGGGRVGYFDSVNRMWMHVLLVALFVVLTQMGSEPTTAQRKSEHRHRRPLVDAGRGLLLGALAISVAGLWSPSYVSVAEAGDERTAGTISAVAVQGTNVVGELVDGSKVEQQVFLDRRIEFPEGAEDREICVGVQFVTFARKNTGSVEVQLALGEFRDRYEVRAVDLEDWGFPSFCLSITDEADLGVPLEITIAGKDAIEGASVSVLRSDQGQILSDGLLFPASVFTNPTRVLPAGLSGPLVMDLRVRYSEWAGDARVVRGRLRAETFPLGLPMVLAVLIVVLIVVDLWNAARQRRPSGALYRRRTPPEVPVIGLAFVAAAALVLTIGISDAVSNRILVPIGSQPESLPGERTSVRLTPGATISQAVPSGLLPDLSRFSRDRRGRNERVCVGFPLQRQASEMTSGDFVLGLVLERRAWRLTPDWLDGTRRFEDRVSLEDVSGSDVIGCFAVSAREVHRAKLVNVDITLVSDDATATVEVTAGSRRGGEPSATTIGSSTEFDSVSALRYRWAREAPSAREQVIGRVGQVALGLGFGLLIIPAAVEQRVRRSVSSVRQQP